MLIRLLYMHLLGYVSITVEGFFAERFINMCLAQDIFLWDIRREKNTYIKVKISSKDFRKIRKIARKTKCRVAIETKKGIPFFIFNYRFYKFHYVSFLLKLLLFTSKVFDPFLVVFYFIKYSK